MGPVGPGGGGNRWDGGDRALPVAGGGGGSDFGVIRSPERAPAPGTGVSVCVVPPPPRPSPGLHRRSLVVERGGGGHDDTHDAPVRWELGELRHRLGWGGGGS